MKSHEEVIQIDIIFSKQGKWHPSIMESLPYELNVYITSLLPLRDLLRLPLLSSSWSSFFQQEWQPKLEQLPLWVHTSEAEDEDEVYLSFSPYEQPIPLLRRGEFTIAWRFTSYCFWKALRRRCRTLSITTRHMMLETTPSNEATDNIIVPQQISILIPFPTRRGNRTIAEDSGHYERCTVACGDRLIALRPDHSRQGGTQKEGRVDIRPAALLSTRFIDLPARQPEMERIGHLNSMQNLVATFATLRLTHYALEKFFSEYNPSGFVVNENTGKSRQLKASLSIGDIRALKERGWTDFFCGEDSYVLASCSPWALRALCRWKRDIQRELFVEVAALQGYPGLYYEQSKGWICRLIDKETLLAIGRISKGIGENLSLSWSLSREEKEECRRMGLCVAE